MYKPFSVACRAADFARALQNTTYSVTIDPEGETLLVSGKRLTCAGAPEPRLPEARNWIPLNLRWVYKIVAKYMHPGLKVQVEANEDYLTVRPEAAGALIGKRVMRVRLKESVEWRGEIRGVDFAVLYEAMKSAGAEPHKIAILSERCKAVALRYESLTAELEAYMTAEPHQPLPIFF